jgi:nucleoside phosphorylase
MSFRTPADVQNEFRAHPRRALILTTVVHEKHAVKAHLSNPEPLIGENNGLYEYGRFADPAGDWLVVHAFTSQGNSDATLVAATAHQEFGSFDVLMFVGVAGSLKEDIKIGGIVVGDYVYNGHAAKVEDDETLARPQAFPAARALLSAAQWLIYTEHWQELIRGTKKTSLPDPSNYPCEFPPSADIKGIVSGEEMVAGSKSPRFVFLRSHFNNCGAVEMEGWGVMNAAHHQNTPAIIVRGISDMCAGKDHEKDQLHQPIAAIHAAAFAFSILSFRSKVPEAARKSGESNTTQPVTGVEPPEHDPQTDPEKVVFVFNFEGLEEEWTEERVEEVFGHLRRIVGDEDLTYLRIEAGSVRLVVSGNLTALQSTNIAQIRDSIAEVGVVLLGAAPLEIARQSDNAKAALAQASADLIAWEKNLPSGDWIERPEHTEITKYFQLDTSTTVLLGEPGSGKSALLSRISSDHLSYGACVFALKADFISPHVATELDLQRYLQLPDLPSELIKQVANLEPVYVFIDQLDALASQTDLRSERLNVFLNLVRRVGGFSNVHILLSARTFEFNHDVRLRTVQAEAIRLTLPPWHEVKERLSNAGINSDAWPEKAREVVRIPQALKTFLTLADGGRTAPFITYQAMLEQLWRDRIVEADDSEALIGLSSDIAWKMADEEALWLAASRFEDRLKSLTRLEALGFIVRSDNQLSVAFAHQTVFDHVLARTFVRNEGGLSSYVLVRQDSLFVRAKLWAGLNYLRAAEQKSYERELLYLWQKEDLRRHLRLLLIEFLGQAKGPLDIEKGCMSDALASEENYLFSLNAISGNPDWLPCFGSTVVRNAMVGSENEREQAVRILISGWSSDANYVMQLIHDWWLPDAHNDGYTWLVIQECPVWTDAVESVALQILGRSTIAIPRVDHLAQSLAITQPELAARLIRAKLEHLVTEASRNERPDPFPESEDQEELIAWYMRNRPNKKFIGILEENEWVALHTLAEAAPQTFLVHLWPWYLSVFKKIVQRAKVVEVKHSFVGQYYIELNLSSSSGSESRERPPLDALQITIEEVARHQPDVFAEWVKENSDFAIYPVQQLIARGYTVSPERFARRALDWLVADFRRFELGTVYSLRDDSVQLVKSCAPYVDQEYVRRFEKAVLNYNPEIPEHISGAEQRRNFLNLVRASKKDLLEAVGVERLSDKGRDLVVTEQRALGERFDQVVHQGEGGYIGSPMGADSMQKAKDQDILKIFREVPDNAGWSHPRDFMRGGNVQLSRAFADFARNTPGRARSLIEQFAPRGQERAAGYALDAMADDADNSRHVTELLRILYYRGFGIEEFKESSARAIEKLALGQCHFDDDIVEILVEWLRGTEGSEGEFADGENVEDTALQDESTLDGTSILWGLGGASVLPGGNFTILAALSATLLSRGESGRDRLFDVLREHLVREQNAEVWKPLLLKLANAGGSSPQIVSDFIRELFSKIPQLLGTREAIIFLAHAQRWDDDLVFEVIDGWASSGSLFQQKAYGELVGVVSILKQKQKWIEARKEIVDGGRVSVRVGLANAAVNLWTEDAFREEAGGILVSVLKGGCSSVVAAVMDVFRVADELPADETTFSLLRELVDPSTDLSAAPEHFVVERLQTLLPNQAELVARLAERLVAAWQDELGDIRTGAAAEAPQLLDLALTLHRLGGYPRQSGLAIFEQMIEMDAYGARDTLAEIDGRFRRYAPAARRRVSRRRKRRARAESPT